MPFPSPGDLPESGIKPRSPALQADALTSEPPEKPDKRTDCMISVPLDREIFAPCSVSLDSSSVFYFIVYGNLDRICILLFCENCINLHHIELVHSAFQVCYILLRLCIFIILIFESSMLKLQLKILLYLL